MQQLIENPVDIYYLTGLKLSKGALLIRGNQKTLYVDGRYIEVARRFGHAVLGEPKSDEPTEFDSETTSVAGYERLKKRFPNLIPVASPLQGKRAVKSKSEIEKLKAAAHLTQKGIGHLISKLKEGVSEKELAWEFEVYVRQKGASGLSFEPIIAFGEGSAEPHHRAAERKLKQNEIVLIDVGAIVDEYRGDLTETTSFGTLDPELKRMKGLVHQARLEALKLVKPGVKVGALDQKVRAFFEEAGVLELYCHALGHGVGLETHEYPRLKAGGADHSVLLEAGMVFTIEPGLYKEGLDGIREEKMVLVTNDGARELC